ncbi:MAG: YceK/YidQ family lipoprotein [Planctomycetes bacterium]|nr:YceK/YidQ family lipoprotein [Planctomycetota bacterium]
MNNRRLGLLTAGVLSSALTGCGTLVNFKDDPKIYGGVQFDAEMVHTIKTDDKMAKSLAAVYAVDLPFSLVADTLTLPVVIPIALINSIWEEKK